MSNQPRITVITPSLNQGRYLERAICSVLDQGYENLQYLVIDGGSSDESVALIHHYDDRIAYWQSRPDRGPGDAINQALAMATGDYVCILPADGVLLPGSLHAVAERLKGADWYVGHCQRIDADDEPLGRWVAEAAELGEYLTLDAGLLPSAASFFHRGLIEAHGGLDHSSRFAFGYELSCRLLAAGVEPTLLPIDVSAHREPRRTRTMAHVLQEGEEYIVAAERYADRLPLTQRHALLTNCVERRRIYAMAKEECVVSDTRRFLWQQLLKRPWWLGSDRYRQTLLDGAPQGAPAWTPERMAA